MPLLLTKTLRPDFVAEPIKSHIWTVLPTADRQADYDQMAVLYDRVVGNALYNRIVWGVSVSDYASAARQALEQMPKGFVLDCGCGSLVFTHQVYRDLAPEKLILFDRSMGMMVRGAQLVPEGTFLQGDALAQPFADNSLSGAMAWGLMHVFGSASPLLSELARVLKPDAPLVISTLVLSGRRVGDTMLKALYKRGEAAEPEIAVLVLDNFKRHFAVQRHWQIGNMLFVSGSAPS